MVTRDKPTEEAPLPGFSDDVSKNDAVNGLKGLEVREFNRGEVSEDGPVPNVAPANAVTSGAPAMPTLDVVAVAKFEALPEAPGGSKPEAEDGTAIPVPAAEYPNWEMLGVIPEPGPELTPTLEVKDAAGEVND